MIQIFQFNSSLDNCNDLKFNKKVFKDCFNKDGVYTTSYYYLKILSPIIASCITDIDDYTYKKSRTVCRFDIDTSVYTFEYIFTNRNNNDLNQFIDSTIMDILKDYFNMEIISKTLDNNNPRINLFLHYFELELKYNKENDYKEPYLECYQLKLIIKTFDLQSFIKLDNLLQQYEIYFRGENHDGSRVLNSKLKIDQSTINEKLPNPPKLTVGNCENEKEQIITSANGKKYMLVVADGKQTIIELESGDIQTNLAIAPSNIETKESVGCRGSEVGAGSSGDADGTNLYSPKVMPKVKLEEELPNFDDEESLTSASGLAKTGSNNGSGTQKNPFSLSSECSSENTIIQDDPTNLFHKLVKINSYYNKGNVGRKFYLIFPKLYHIKLVSVEDNKDNHSIRFQFKNNLTREDIESGIGDVVDHRLAKQFQEEVSDLVVEYKYPVNFNISDVNEIRAPKVVGAEVFYVDYTTLRYK
ncbi:hypothetical protein ACTFIY_004053 [Dictyostelium cf. discoideum]